MSDEDEDTEGLNQKSLRPLIVWHSIMIAINNLSGQQKDLEQEKEAT